jgi:hypothetical protein
MKISTTQLQHLKQKPRDGNKPPKVTFKKGVRGVPINGFSGVRASYSPVIFTQRGNEMCAGYNNGI